MSNENDSFHLPVSPEGSTRSPVMVSDETTYATNDQDDAALIARDEVIFVPTTFTNTEEISIEIGRSQPLGMGNSPNIAANDLPFDNQPIELDGYHGQSPDEILYTLSPINLVTDDNHVVPLSPAIQNATGYANIPYDDNLLNEGETLAEPVQDEDDDIQVLLVETVAMQTVESPVRHEPMNDDVHNILAEPIVEIDLTQDETENEEEPEVIDLTADDDEQEEVCPVQSTPVTNHNNDNELINQSQSAPSVVAIPITEVSPPVVASSSEATDQNPNIINTIVDSNQTIEATAHLQVLISSSRTNKRSSSSDEIRHADKKDIASKVKRWRISAS